VSRRFLTALAIAVAAIAFGVAPALAATQGCHTTPPCAAAECVYVQQVPNSGACPKKPVHHAPAPPTTYTQPTYTQPTYTQPVTSTVKPKPHHARHKIKRHRKIATVPAIKASALHTPPPSAVSAAFDLGLGPTALFAALLAVAALLALGGGLQNRRR
jgi:hypothetical protein